MANCDSSNEDIDEIQNEEGENENQI